MVLGNRVAELDAQLLEMIAYLEEEFYPRFLTTISGRQWLLSDGPLAEIPKAEELQPSLEQLMLPNHMAEDDVVWYVLNYTYHLPRKTCLKD
ncbi:hypothetical protein Tco_0498075 [Tanacetum coccineum]